MAVDSLMAVAKQLHGAHQALADKLMGRHDLPEHHTLDLFYQSVKACADVQDFILRTAARLNLPIQWLPDRIAEQNFNLDEPPTRASAWVGVLLNQHLKVFRERLSIMPTLSASDVDQVAVTTRHCDQTSHLHCTDAKRSTEPRLSIISRHACAAALMLCACQGTFIFYQQRNATTYML